MKHLLTPNIPLNLSNDFCIEFLNKNIAHKTNETIRDFKDLNSTYTIQCGDIREFVIGHYSVMFVIISNVDKDDLPIVAGICKYNNPATIEDFKLNNKYIVQFWNMRTLCIPTIKRSMLIDICLENELAEIKQVALHELLGNSELPRCYETRIGSRIFHEKDIRIKYRQQILEDWQPVDLFDLKLCGVIK